MLQLLVIPGVENIMPQTLQGAVRPATDAATPGPLDDILGQVTDLLSQVNDILGR